MFVIVESKQIWPTLNLGPPILIGLSWVKVYKKGLVAVKALLVELKILLCDSKFANKLQDEIHNTCVFQC
jgi:hypothetical protein